MTQVRTEQYAYDYDEPAGVNFLNTDYDGRERLRSYEDACSWLRSAGALSDGPPSPGEAQAQQVLATVRSVREAGRQIARSAAEGHTPPPDAIRVINAALLRHREELAYDGAFRVEARPPQSPHDVPAVFARTLSELFARRDPSRIKRCPGCGMFIYDASPRSNRVWCSMKTCGNRAKASAHYRRGKTVRA